MSQDDRIKEAFEMIEEGVKNVYNSDNYKQYLSFVNKFHDYSLNNCILIINQMPQASFIAGFNSWKQKFNRHVNKGEKAIRILAPYQVPFKHLVDKKDEQGNILYDTNGESIKEEKESNITRFRMVSVFDVSQTSGDPIPSLVHDLQGSSDDALALISAIEEISDIPINYKTVDEDQLLASGSKGYYSVTNKEIIVNQDLSTIQKAKTLVHEFAHSRLHDDINNDKSKDTKEIEAESIAFSICDHFNIDTSEYSFPYIASYAEKDISFLKTTLGNIQDNIHEYIARIEPVFLRIREEQMIDNKYLSPIELAEYSSDFIAELEELHNLNDYGFAIEENEPYITQEFKDVTTNMLLNIESKYPGQSYLYINDLDYRAKVFETIFQHVYKHNQDARPLVEKSLEHLNYNKFKEIASPLLTDDAYYMKFESPGMLELVLEKIDDDRIAMAHYFEMNGDLMADPDIEFVIDTKNELIIPKTYQLDSMQIYQNEYTNPNISAELNPFMKTWLQNINDQQYKVQEILGEDLRLNRNDNMKDLQKFCKEHKITKVMPKRKELER